MYDFLLSPAFIGPTPRVWGERDAPRRAGAALAGMICAGLLALLPWVISPSQAAPFGRTGPAQDTIHLPEPSDTNTPVNQASLVTPLE